jgi:hypothetical protein
MKKSRRFRKRHNKGLPRMKENVQVSTPEPRPKPKTYEVLQVDSDDELAIVRMTAREIFEENCVGHTPETYTGLDEVQIRDRMRVQAGRRVLLEDKWHPEDVSTVAEACTDYILEFREMKKLDAAQINRVAVPATPPQRK